MDMQQIPIESLDNLIERIGLIIPCSYHFEYIALNPPYVVMMDIRLPLTPMPLFSLTWTKFLQSSLKLEIYTLPFFS